MARVPARPDDTEITDLALSQQLGALAVEVSTLRRELADLRTELATEVRTRRLCVIDDQGTERIFTDVEENYSEFVVSYGYAFPNDFSDETEHVKTVMMAGDEGNCVYVSAAGNILGALHGDRDSGAYLELERDSTSGSDYSRLDPDGFMLVGRPGNTVNANAVLQIPSRTSK